MSNTSMCKEQNICGITRHNEMRRITKKRSNYEGVWLLRGMQAGPWPRTLQLSTQASLGASSVKKSNLCTGLLSCCWVIDDHSGWHKTFLCLKLRIVLIAGLSPQIWRSRRDGRRPWCVNAATESSTPFKANYRAAELMSAEHWQKSRCKG